MFSDYPTVLIKTYESTEQELPGQDFFSGCIKFFMNSYLFLVAVISQFTTANLEQE